MRTIGLVATGCVLLLAACANTGGQGEARLERLLPSPGFADGWTIDGPVSYYDPETVFDYIDGEAELYFPYGFKAVVTATYLHNGDPQDSVTADIYAMGSLLDAFGIYSNYRFPGADHVPFGAEGHCDGYQLMFYQDRYFVRIAASGDPDQNAPVLEACAQAIAQALPGDGTTPWELTLLQPDGLVPGTRKYIADSLLGYAFFPKGLIAKIQLGENTVRAFLVFEASPEAAAKALDKYAAYLKEAGSSPTMIPTAAGDALAAKDPLYKGVVALQSEPYLLGVIGVDNPAQGASLVEDLATRLPRE